MTGYRRWGEANNRNSGHGYYHRQRSDQSNLPHLHVSPPSPNSFSKAFLERSDETPIGRFCIFTHRFSFRYSISGLPMDSPNRYSHENVPATMKM
jgi:hypothetical protein